MSTTASRIEEAVIARVKTLAGDYLREVTDIPNDWRSDSRWVDRLLRSVPGVYVCWLGGPQDPSAANEPRIQSSVGVLVATGQTTERDRRHGTGREVGAYELIDVLVPGLHAMNIEGLGPMLLTTVVNLFEGSLESKGLALYGLYFSLRHDFPDAVDLDTLTPFERVRGSITAVQPADAPAALVDTDLPQD